MVALRFVRNGDILPRGQRLVAGLPQFCMQFGIEAVSAGIYAALIERFADLCKYGTSRFMKMAAVVEPACGGMATEVWHMQGQFGWSQVMQAEFLESWRVDDGGVGGAVHPVPMGGRGGVPA